MNTERPTWDWSTRVVVGLVAGGLAYVVTGLSNFWLVGPETRLGIAVAVGVLVAIFGPVIWELFSSLWW